MSIISLNNSTNPSSSANAANPAGAVPLMGKNLASGPLEARFRPEATRLVTQGAASGEAGAVFAGTVETVSYPGGLWRHGVRVGGEIVLADAAQAVAPGTAVDIRVAPEALFLFPASATAAPSPFQPGEPRRSLEMSAR